VQSPTVQVPSLNASTPLVQAGQVALRFLQDTGQAQKNQAFQIVHAMATAAVSNGVLLPHIEFESSALKEWVAPNSSKQASGWLSPLWRQLEKEQDRWLEGMVDTAVGLGAEYVPRLRKLEGSPAKYQLVAEALERSSSHEANSPTPPGGLRYTPAAVAAPGSLVSAGLRTGVLRHTVAFIAMAGAVITVLIALVVLSAWWLIVNGLQLNTPLTVAHLCLALSWGLIAWGTYRCFDFLAKLGDLGIVMAPEILLPFKEDHVTLELRPRNNERRGEFAFVRYTAVCPVCAGKVLLHEGGRDFRGRIVGRCRDSPREHVFSFDQKLHIGNPLRR